ncbi:MAG TPA: LCP family protein [Streptomyces sp.]|nr:LCP family protein [Streptomyces sp.]
MRQHHGTRGERGHSRRPSADELGWDDSLYGGGRPPGPRRGGHDDLAEQDDAGRPPGRAARRRQESERPSRRKKPKRRVWRWIVLTLSLLILATAGAGYLYLQHLNGNLEKDPLNLGKHKLDKAAPNAAGQTPLNILLLGSDSRNSKENVSLGGSKENRGTPPRADVQMLLHVAADRSSMTVISVPRDTLLTIPQCTDADTGKVYPETKAKINTSLQHGGPGCTVATWESLTGIPIDHFMMIDFAGVVDMADAVGGVPVCVDANVYDSKSGLRLKEGTTTIKGKQALQWLRTRHGFDDGTDIARSRAQHQYMSSMVRQLKAGTKLTDPGKLRSLAEAATKALTVDNGLGSVTKLFDLAKDLKQVPTDRITMVTMPWKYYGAHQEYVVPTPEADKIFSLIRQDVALDGKDKEEKKKSSPPPSDLAAPKSEIAVSVLNGTGTINQPAVSGRAGHLTQQLVAQGFTQATTDATPKSQADTSLSFADPDQRGDALAVAKALGIPEKLVEHSSAVQGITLVVGADWRQGDTYPAAAQDPAKQKEERDKAVEASDVVRGGNKGACMHVNPENVW